MTLAMLGMLWRGEAWKTVYLAEEAQSSQGLQLSPKIESISQCESIPYAGFESFDHPLFSAAREYKNEHCLGTCDGGTAFDVLKAPP